MTTTSENATYTAPDGKSWAERRRVAPTSLELYRANTAALEAARVGSCQMRYSLVGEAISFYFRFENELPSGRIGFTFPVMYPENLIKEGWKKYFLTLDIHAGGQLVVEARGRFERDGVPLDVLGEFIRVVGGGPGVAHDQITWTDPRNKESVGTTMEALLDEKFKDGTPKYCRKGDSLRDLSIEGWVAVITRYAKDSALRRRAVKI